MTLDRRRILAGGIGLGALAAGPRAAPAAPARRGPETMRLAASDIAPDGESDQTEVLQRAADAAALSGEPLELPAGRFRVRRLELRSGTQILGVPGRTVLEHHGDGAMIVAQGANGIRLAGLAVDGGGRRLRAGGAMAGLVEMRKVEDLMLMDCSVGAADGHGLSLTAVSGSVRHCRISGVAGTALYSLDAAGLEVSDNTIADCGNNGIQVWRSEPGEDGTIVAHNRIEGVRADAGGSGQNGNGVNVFRAGSVIVTGNRIADCAFSAIRGNAASNAQFIANACARLGEVAIYAEFGFEGAIIANNIVDGALTGISITNFKEGGRLALAQGNLVRNLTPGGEQKGHGIGIAVEADTVVTGNVVEGAPGVGIQLGWGRFLRDVTATNNIVRQARIGIGISADAQAGYALVTNNLVSATTEGAIRAMDHARPLGPDLTKESAESYRNMAVFANVGL